MKIIIKIKNFFPVYKEKKKNGTVGGGRKEEEEEADVKGREKNLGLPCADG